jgi:hypothetical protein
VRGQEHIPGRTTRDLRVAMIAVVTAIATLLVAMASVHGRTVVFAQLAPDLERVLGDADLRQAAIIQDVRYRAALGLEADPGWVEQLYASPGLTVGTRFAGALLTPHEWQEVAARGSLERDADAIETYYAGSPGERGDFGGVRIDHEAGGVLAVYLRGIARPAVLTRLERPDRLSIRPALASLDELVDLQDRVRFARDRGDRVALGVVGTRLDLDRGEVVVGFDPDALAGLREGALPDRFERRFGKGHLRAEAWSAERSPRTFVAGDRYENAVTSAHWCSFGFKMVRVDGASDVDGANDQDLALAAGHCARGPRATVYARTSPFNTRIGQYERVVFADGSDGDLALIRLDPGYQIEPMVRHIVGSTAYQLQVKGLALGTTMGAIRCMTGTGGGTECGPITGVDTESTYENRPGNPTVRNLVQLGSQDIPFDSAAGDSGGPVYRLDLDEGVVYAAGVFAAHGPTCDDPMPQCWYGKFTKLTSIPSSWGVRVSVDPHAEGCQPGSILHPCPTDPDEE